MISFYRLQHGEGQGQGFFSGIFKTLFYSLFVASLTLGINKLIKVLYRFNFSGIYNSHTMSLCFFGLPGKNLR